MAVSKENQEKKLEELMTNIDNLLIKSDEVLENFYDMEITNFKDDDGNPLSLDAVVGDKLEFINMQYKLNVANGTTTAKEESKFQADLKKATTQSEEYKSRAKELAETFLKYKTSLLEYNDKQIEELSKAIVEMEKKDKELADEIEGLEAEILELEAEDKRIDSNIKRNENQIAKFEEEINKIEEQTNQNTEKIKDIDDQIAELEALKSSEKDPDKIAEYEAKISNLNSEREGIITTQDELDHKLSDLDYKCKSAKSRLDKYKDKKTEISKTISDKKSLLESKKNEKESLKIDDKKKEVEELKKYNQELYKSFDKDFDNLDEKLSKYGMSLDSLDLSKDEKTPKEPSDPKEEKKEKKDEKEEKAQKSSGGGVTQVAQNVQDEKKPEENMPVPMTPRMIAQSIYDDFCSLNAIEQAEVLNGDGYNDLLSAIPNLNHKEKKNLKDIIDSKKAALGTIKVDEFNELEDSLSSFGIDLGDLKSELFYAHGDDEGKFYGLDEVKKSTLIKLTNLLGQIESQRKDMPPELLEKLDKNLINYVKYDTLSSNLGGFMTKLMNAFTPGLNKAKKGVTGALASYTSTNSNIIKQEMTYATRNNKFREELGQNIYPPTTPIAARGLKKAPPTTSDRTL